MRYTVVSTNLNSCVYKQQDAQVEEKVAQPFDPQINYTYNNPLSIDNIMHGWP